MATTWGYMAPSSFTGGDQRTPDSISLPFTGSFVTDDVLIISAGVLAKGASNAAVGTLAGLALKDSGAIYTSSSPSSTTLFGASTTGTALTPGEPTNAQVYPFRNGNLVEFSLKDVWNPGTNAGPGTAVGLLLDGTTNFFVLDSTQTNKPFIILQPLVTASQMWAVGDSGIRVLAYVPTSTATGV